jgi:hypothetical protein
LNGHHHQGSGPGAKNPVFFIAYLPLLNYNARHVAARQRVPVVFETGEEVVADTFGGDLAGPGSFDCLFFRLGIGAADVSFYVIPAPHAPPPRNFCLLP